MRARRLLSTLATPFEGRYAKVIALIFACLVVLLAWNAVHFPTGEGGDSTDHFRYTDSLRLHHRFPTPNPRPRGLDPAQRVENTGQWYNPPLFYLTAAGIEAASGKLADAIGAPFDAKRQRKVEHKVVQLFIVLLAVGVALFAFLTARELLPRSRTAQVSVLAFVVLSPTFIRTAVSYHGQMLATLFSTAALYVVSRALVRRQVSVRAGAIAGVLLGLGVLTRHFVLATAVAMCVALGAYYLFTRERDTLRMGAVLVLSIALLTTPWFIHQQVEYGNAFVASAKPPDKPFFSRHPAEFYFGQPLKAVFTQPYRPTFDNRMPQQLYTDWWGDYFLYFDVPRELRIAQVSKKGKLTGRPEEDRLPDSYHKERVRQAYVGLLPTLLIVAGLVGLIWEGVRRRAAHLLAIPVMIGAIAVQALTVYIGYPTADGDIMRATYLLTAVPPLALAVGWWLSRLREKNALAFGLIVGALAVAALVDLHFLWLNHFVGRAG